MLKGHLRSMTFANHLASNVFQASHVHFSVFVLWFGLGGLCISTGDQISTIHIHPHSHDVPTTVAGGIAYEGVAPFQVLLFSLQQSH